jgi:predicted glycoside hydrolase/deacetylase ChbG (UPF0249 family)
MSITYPQLIVNADDFGLSPAVNAAVLQAHQRGIVTSTTVMINLPHAEAGLAQALAETPNLGLGLHLNLNQGKPVSPPTSVPSLVDEHGQFYPIERLAEVALGYDGDELYEEIAAQIERFIALTGHPPTHLDAHYHVALMHPLALEAVLHLAAEYSLPKRDVAVHGLTPEQAVATVQHFMPFIPKEFVLPLVDQLQQVLADGPPAIFPARFENRFHAPHNTLGDLLNILTDVAQTQRPTELMIHVGFAEDAGVKNGASRQREFDAICHSATQEVVERLGIRLVNYKTLAGSSKD